MNIKKELETGKYLFKYCSFNTNTLQIIINNHLHFAFPHKLNDPLDSKFKIKISNPQNFSNKTINEIKGSRIVLNDKISLLLKDVNLQLGDKEKQKELLFEYFSFIQNNFFGLCCFSKTYENNLMWSHYTNEAKGLCLVFDKALLLKSTEDYINNNHYHLINENVTYRGIKNLNVTLLKNGKIKYSLNHFFSKTKHWKYEEEYRMVLAQKTRTAFDFNPILFYPFVKFDKNSLKYVIIGERMSSEHQSLIKNVLNQEQKIFKHIFQ